MRGGPRQSRFEPLPGGPGGPGGPHGMGQRFPDVFDVPDEDDNKNGLDRGRSGRDVSSRERDRGDRDRDRGRRSDMDRPGDRRRNDRDRDRDRSRSDRRDDDRKGFAGKDEFGRDIDLIGRRRGSAEGLSLGQGGQPNDKQERNLCIEVRNMSRSATFADVRRFFANRIIPNTGLKLINDTHGNRTGIAYVRFIHKRDYDAALEMSGSLMKNEQVEILPIPDDLFDKAVDSYVPGSPTPKLDEPHSLCVRCDDLPFNTKEDVIRQIFQEYQFDVALEEPRDMSSRSAILKFRRMEDVKKLFNSAIKFSIEGREIKLSSCPEHLFHESRSNQNGRLEHNLDDFGLRDSAPRSLRDESPIPSIPTDVLLLKNLPPTVRDRDITDFFSDVGLVPHKIHMLVDPFGKPVGEAFCEFNDGVEAAKGLRKDSTHMGKFIVNVKPVSRPEMGAVLNQPMMPTGPMGNFGMMQPRMMGPRHTPLLGAVPQGFPGRIPELQDIQPEPFGKPGCVIHCENVPFRAEIEDILEYFSGFNLTKENVIRRFNDRGLATGDARVALNSPEEAQSAMQKLKGKKMFGRLIWLSLL